MSYGYIYIHKHTWDFLSHSLSLSGVFFFLIAFFFFRGVWPDFKMFAVFVLLQFSIHSIISQQHSEKKKKSLKKVNVSVLKCSHKNAVAAELWWKDILSQHLLPGLLEQDSPFLSPGILRVPTQLRAQALKHSEGELTTDVVLIQCRVAGQDDLLKGIQTSTAWWMSILEAPELQITRAERGPCLCRRIHRVPG